MTELKYSKFNTTQTIYIHYFSKSSTTTHQIFLCPMHPFVCWTKCFSVRIFITQNPFSKSITKRRQNCLKLMKGFDFLLFYSAAENESKSILFFYNDLYLEGSHEPPPIRLFVTMKYIYNHLKNAWFHTNTLQMHATVIGLLGVHLVWPLLQAEARIGRSR